MTGRDDTPQRPEGAKPCPFCGSNALTFWRRVSEKAVLCENCGGNAPTVGHWNARAPQPSSAPKFRYCEGAGAARCELPSCLENGCSLFRTGDALASLHAEDILKAQAMNAALRSSTERTDPSSGESGQGALGPLSQLVSACDAELQGTPMSKLNNALFVEQCVIEIVNEVEKRLSATRRTDEYESRYNWLVGKLDEKMLHQLVPDAADKDGCFTYERIEEVIDAKIATRDGGADS